MAIINSWFTVWEQVDWSLIYPSWNILLPEQREIIISNSLNTPVRWSESDIKAIIKDASNSILIWETWSWKTTELAQMIHEVFPEDLIITNIPLVAATIWTWSYVSDIMFAKTWNPYYALWQGWVWYRTWKWVSEEKRAQITFNTYWLDYLNLSLWNFEQFLNKSSKNIHIILDEIHEKGEDFVFYLTKVLEFSNKFPWRVKLYWASATVSDNYLDLLVEKFKTVSKEVPITKVDWRTFPINTVEDNWWDIVEKVCNFYKDWKSILAFQPWKAEIAKTIAAIKEKLWDKIEIYPFHSEVSSDELEKNLQSSDSQKIFVATNAARTWITLDINAVADSWIEKNQYYNEYWIPVLVSEAITQDAYHQNKWRAWRKEEWDAIYLWYIPVSELKEEAPSSVEVKVDEKKILMELLDKRNILVNENKWVHNYLFNPNKRMLEFSYKWMKSCGLMTENEKMTKYWFESLKLPLSVFNWRIILEAIENNIADELVTIVSIIENKGFIKRNFNISKFAQNLFDTSSTDLDLYKKLFDILSSKEIDDKILNVFENMWIERSLINYFKSLKWEEKFYKVVWEKLEEIWLKFKSIERIDETIEKINKYLSNNKDYLNSTKSELTWTELNELIYKCLLSWSLHKIYKANWNNSFEDFYQEQADLNFEQSDTSYVNVNNWSIYIWEPFIIWWAWDKEDLSILSLITLIDEKDIDFFAKRVYEEYVPKKQIARISDFSVDESWDTFNTHESLVENSDKQKYLSFNWLPFYLIEKNPFFKEFIKNFNWDFDKDIFIQLLQTYTVKHFSKINPNNKEETINFFENDKTILEWFIKSENETIKKFLKWEKVEIVKEHKVETKKTDFLRLIEIQNEYNKTLVEIKKYLESYWLDIDNIQENKLDLFINQLEENSEAYSKIIIFLKRLTNNKSDNTIKSGIKWEFKSYNNWLNQILKISKRNSWLESFIENLELLLEWKDISLKELKFWIINDNNLLLTSPLIRQNKLLEDINQWFNKLKSVKKSLKKISYKWKKYIKLIISLQKLFFVNNQWYRAWLKNVNFHISQFKILIKENISKINELRENKLSSNAEEINKLIKELNISNSIIFTTIKRIEEFKIIALNIKEKVDSIDFSTINYNSEYTNWIYTKKFLYNVIIKNIFDWDFVALNDEDDTKLLEKLWLYLNNDSYKKDELIIIIKNVINSNLKKNSWELIKTKKKESTNNAMITLESHISLFKEIFIKYELEKKLSIENIEWDNFKNVNLLTSNLRNILLEFYSEEIVNLNESKIFNFANKLYNYNINNFDNALKFFIINFSWIVNIKWNLFKKIDRYISLNEEISSYSIIEKIKKSDLNQNDIIKLRENRNRVNEINNDIKSINSFIEKIISTNLEIIESNTGYGEYEIRDNIQELNDVLNMYIDDKLYPKDIDSNFNITLFEWYIDMFYEFKTLKPLEDLKPEFNTIIEWLKNILTKIELLVENKEFIDFERTNLHWFIEKYTSDIDLLKNKTKEIKTIIDYFSK